MTPEQFVYWLSGYLSGLKHDETVKSLFDVLSQEVPKVRNNHSLMTLPVFHTNQGCL